MRWYESAVGSVSVGALCCVVSATAAAQDGGDPAAARALFAEARALVNSGRAKDACPKFEESLRLDHGIGTQFNLADCWERIGRSASAWALFLDVAAAARSANQSDREALAQERAKALEPHLSRLIVRVDQPASDLEVSRDGIKLGAALFGTAVPVDPGTHVLRAAASGTKPWSQAVVVPERQGTVTVVIPPLEPAPRDAGSAEPSEGTAPASHVSVAPHENAESRGGASGAVIGAIVTGVLAAGFAVTGVLYSAAHNEFDRANVAEESSRFDKRDRARTLGIANVALLSGTVIAGGVTVYLWLGASSPESPAADGFVDPAFYGITVRGTL